MPPDITPATAAAPSSADTSAPNTGVTPDTSAPEGDTSADLSADGAVQPAPTEKKVESRIKKLKLKVDGREYEEEVNFDDDEYLTKQMQLAKAAQKRMGEYATLEKQVKSFIEELKKNPRKVLADPNIGIDVKQLAASIIEEEIANSQKSPEQLEKEKLETRLRELEDERKKEKEDFERKEFERLQQQAYERYDTQMATALEKSDLPKSPYVIKKMADYMLLGLQQGLDVTADDVIPLVREEIQSDLKEMFAVMPEDVIEKIIGKDPLNRIRKKNVAKAKAVPQQTGKPKDVGANESAKSSAAKKQTFKDFFGL
jgi:hypothetical protein